MPLFVRQFRLFLDLSLRPGRQQVHQQVRQSLGKLAARHDARDAGRLRVAGELLVHVGEKPDDGQSPRSSRCRSSRTAPEGRRWPKAP